MWSFAHFVPKEIVRGLIDNSISTRLGGTKQDITLVFTDVQGFTTIAEAADPDVLMRQTSRYFSVLTEAFLAEGGTVDKFIGDAVMVFWNAPHPQTDHVARACRAVLAAKAAGERLNAEFEADGLKPFIDKVRHSCRRSRGRQRRIDRAHELHGTRQHGKSGSSARGPEQGNQAQRSLSARTCTDGLAISSGSGPSMPWLPRG